VTTADAYSETHFGGAAFAAFDPASAALCTAAAALRDRLIAIGFGPDRAAALFGLETLADLRPPRDVYYDELVLPHDAAGQAARFFVLHQEQGDAQLRAWLGDAATDLLIGQAAIVTVAGTHRSLVSATWFAGRLIFADARAYNVVWPGEPFADYVMPPGRDSVGLERVAPRGPRRATLDLCCGPGTQSLAAAAYSDRVTGVDLNPRAVRFARFNAALNRITTATFLQGDLYAPLGAERFDAILSNPPFVPWPADDAELLFRGGGARGEDVLIRILAGAVERLEPHGVLTIVADLADAHSLPARIVRWQGVPRRTLLVLQQQYPLLEYAETHAAHHDEPAEQKAQTVRLLRHFSAAGIGTLDLGYIVQDGMPGPASITRTNAPHAADISADVADWFASQRCLQASNAEDALLTLAPALRLVEVAEHDTAGTRTAYYAAPGPASLLDSSELTPAAFTLLTRIATTATRVRDVSGERDLRELVTLLRRGVLRVAPWVTPSPSRDGHVDSGGSTSSP
jgi:carbamoyltransferase